MQIDSSFCQSLASLLASKPKILLTAHHNPDGDAVGSLLGLYSLLAAQGHQVELWLPNDFPVNLQFLAQHEKIQIFEADAKAGARAVAEAELIFHLDYNHLGRSGSMESALRQSAAPKVMIDHHQAPEDFAQWCLSRPEMSSTCEMVYHFAMAMQWQDYLQREGATALYLGMMTDTGNFRFSSVSPATHRAVAHLLELGVSPQEAAVAIYDSNKLSRFRLLGRLLNRMEYLADYGTVILALSQKDLDECGYERGDTEGFVNYGLSLKGVELSIFLMPRDGNFKLSLRSKGDFDVNQMARAHFKGGGHRNAAGGSSDLSLEDSLVKIKNLLVQYRDALPKL